MKKKNNNKSYGLCKERQLKKKLQDQGNYIEVTRSRGSFGNFDIQAYGPLNCYLISVKSTRQQTWSSSAEITKLKNTLVPPYCKKWLFIWWSPRSDREKKGWEVINCD